LIPSFFKVAIVFHSNLLENVKNNKYKRQMRARIGNSIFIGSVSTKETINSFIVAPGNVRQHFWLEETFISGFLSYTTRTD